MSDISELFRLQELEASLLKLKELKASNGLAFYKPHPKQELFHSAGEASRRYVRSGNRWGKSTAGVAEDLAWLIGERIWYPENDPRRSLGIPKRPVKGVLIVQDWDKADELFTSQTTGAGQGKIFQLLPKESLVSVESSKAGNICKITVKSIHDGNSVLHIDTVRSFVQNPQGHESSDWDFIHVDEPLPKEMWSAYARGLLDRPNTAAWFLCTPLAEQWINDYFIPRADSKEYFEEGKRFSGESSNFWVLTGKSSDNPTISAEALKDFARDISADELEARLNGRPRAYSGLIYTDFDRSKHVYTATPHGWISPTQPPPDWTIRVAIDPHPKIPMAVLFCATGPLGQTFFFREIFLKHFIQDLCENIWSVLTYKRNGVERRYEPYQIICDPLAWTPNPITGQTMADVFWQHDVPVSKAPKALSEGILRVGSTLRFRDADNNPEIFFHESLHQTLFEFDRYCWDEKKESPRANCSDHMMENLYRLVLIGLTYVDRAETPPTIKPLEVVRSNFSLPSSDTRAKPRTFDRYPA